MSIHINAKVGEIASTVLMPGDPLRAQFIADNYLKDVTKVSQTRNALYFTGTYNNTRITVLMSKQQLVNLRLQNTPGDMKKNYRFAKDLSLIVLIR